MTNEKKTRKGTREVFHTADFLARQASQAKRPVPAVLRLFGRSSPTREWLLLSLELRALGCWRGLGRMCASSFLPPSDPPPDMACCPGFIFFWFDLPSLTAARSCDTLLGSKSMRSPVSWREDTTQVCLLPSPRFVRPLLFLLFDFSVSRSGLISSRNWLLEQQPLLWGTHFVMEFQN